MLNFEEKLVEAIPVNRWTIQAHAERLRGQETRRMAIALKRWLANAIAGYWGRRAARQAV